MTSFRDRRSAIQAMLSASAGAMLPSPVRPGGGGGLLSARAGGGAEAGPAAEPDTGPIRRRILEAIARGGATGVAIAVAYQGRMVLEEGFGWADREARVPVTPHTPFSLASITKPFTATTMMTLVAEGKLDLDAPATRYLPELAGVLGGQAAPTVRQLGAHVSGLPTMFESYERSEARMALSPEGLLRSYGRLAYPPGRCYEYSNLGFAALDAMARRLTGQAVGALMRERVLRPLGLADSFFDTDASRMPGAAVRYDPRAHAIPFYTTSTPASGELYASAHDLLRFAMFSMKQHVEGRRGRVLNDSAIDELFRPVFPGPSGVTTTFGWFTGRLPTGALFAMKAGGQAGVATILYLLPSEQLACLVLTNQSDARELAVGVCDQLVRGYVPEWRQPQETSGPQPAPFAATPAIVGRWTGTLRNGGAQMPVRLLLEGSGSASLAIGVAGPEAITELRLEGEALTGKTMGRIDSADALRTGARMLELKLLPQDGRLMGRVLALAGDPNFRNVRLPYAVGFERVRG